MFPRPQQAWHTSWECQKKETTKASHQRPYLEHGRSHLQHLLVRSVRRPALCGLCVLRRLIGTTGAGGWPPRQHRCWDARREVGKGREAVGTAQHGASGPVCADA